MIHAEYPPSAQGLYDPRYEHDACGIGFIADIKGRKSHETVQMALQALVRLDHRGARGCEDNTGDGAGILMQIPHTFLQESCEGLGIELPEPGTYGVGMVFSTDSRLRRSHVTRIFQQIIQEEGQRLLGWRKVPTDNFHLGPTSRASEPFVSQVLIGRGPEVEDDLAFERKLYVIRKRASNAVHYAGVDEMFYVPSLSSRTIVYKGMLTPGQLKEFYPDLSDPRVETAIAMFHSRFSTNTFPTWERAHPFRYIIHNGEINTLRGNRNWMKTREAMLASDRFGPDLAKVLPVLTEGGSDSSSFDDCLELLTLAGRSMAHAVMMMIPEPWENHVNMDPERRAFYQYHSCLMEPWDGPASIAFTDGTVVGACLDRNGFRPSRYYVTKDDLVVLASETGVVDIPPEDVAFKGRLQPGRMLLIDTHEGRIIEDEEVKRRVAREHPYQQWLDQHLLPMETLPAVQAVDPDAGHEAVLRLQRAFGYTFEEQRVFLGPMTRIGRDPVGSMGNDAALAVLSDKPRLLYDYFKQLFAQVTNPPVDPYKEAIITSSQAAVGPERNLLEPEPESCRQIRLQTPVLTDEQMVQLKQIDRPGLKSIDIPILFRAAEGEAGLSTALRQLFESADIAIGNGRTILILTDRGVDSENAPIPALLAVAGLHHHLIRCGTRTRVGILLESGEPRTVHHFCTLIGYGAQAVNPYMAFAGIADMIREGMLTDIIYADAVDGYVRSATNGLVKVMAKMGISTVRSYCGAQIFEAEGLKREFIDRYFTWTDSRIEGVGLSEIAREALERHAHAYLDTQSNGQTLAPGGHYQWRKDGEYHLFNPITIHKLQKAVRTNDYEVYREYADQVNDQSVHLATLRGLLQFTNTEDAVPLDQVQSVEEICRRFKTGAMSYGSISQEAHEALAIAMNRLGGKSNTGEGGEDPARYIPMPNGDSKNSAIKQVASGRFGVTSQYLVNARELQIKMAQGAKPGEGGELPGHKVYPWIARVRHATPGVELISPPPHHDIYSIEDLAQLIHDLKNANDQARISVKLVSEVGVGTIAAGVAKGHADVILISGHDGGTGASPQTSIKHSGMPWELGLAETHQTLLLNNLRGRVVVEADGQLKTGRDVVIAALLGAEEFGFATTALVAMGCVMMRVCHLDTCPVGVATQNPELRKRFMGSPEHVQSFLRFVAQDVREIMAGLGFRTLNEMVGRSDRLTPRENVSHWKAKGLDLSRILHRPRVDPQVSRHCQFPQDHGLENAVDNQVLLDLCEPALERGEKVRAVLPIKNTNRVVGTILGSEITRKYGAEGLPDDTIDIKFRGSAGQSFAAFAPRGITFRLEGDANDYFGKGLSGARLMVYPPEGATFVPRENIIIGNVSFYGATSGEAYIRGMAGERFCVRNSGVSAVVEAVGDHGCEYMTGGSVVVLGPTGRNFAAGMSGGVAYVLDEDGGFHGRCNTEMSDLERLSDLQSEEIDNVRSLVERHAHCTASNLAFEILDDWAAKSEQFVRVMPRDYRRVMEALERARAEGLEGEDAWFQAFRDSADRKDAAHL